MKFSFQNLGLIEQADIELKGLTILTGLNDTGKSLISKAIYSIIKALNESVPYIDRKRHTSTVSTLQQINLYHRQTVPFTQDKVQQFNISPLTNKSLETFVTKISLPEDFKIMVEEYKNKVINDIQSLQGNPTIVKQRLATINQLFGSINNHFKELSNQERFCIYFDEEIIQKLYQAQINNLSDEKKNVEISIHEGETTVLNFSISQNKTKVNEIADTSLLSLIKDVTIIDTPLIINLERYITYTLAYQQPAGTPIPIHYLDLCRKLNSSGAISSDSFSKILDKTKTIIEGQVIFKAEQGGVLYEKQNGSIFRVNNIATGIKSFGLLQLLLRSGSINESSLLIIDEPEVHLHLKWQLFYAEIIVALSAAGIPIMISTHSPFFLEAITVYVKQYQRENDVAVYHGQKNKEIGTTTFQNVTNNLDTIFTQLSEPIAQLQMLI